MLLAARAENERLRQIIKELQRYRFGPRAEGLPEDQLLLGLDGQQVEAEGFAGTEAADPSKRFGAFAAASSWDDLRRQSMRSAQRRPSTSAIEPCCYSPRRAFATVSYAPFSCRISTGVLARYRSGAPRASGIGWRRRSRRPAPRSPTTSCALDRRWIVRICSCPSRRPWQHSNARLRHGGVELGRVAGAHLLRHSLATQLVKQ